jgi:hypothetical protein
MMTRIPPMTAMKAAWMTKAMLVRGMRTPLASCQNAAE